MDIRGKVRVMVRVEVMLNFRLRFGWLLVLGHRSFMVFRFEFNTVLVPRFKLKQLHLQQVYMMLPPRLATIVEFFLTIFISGSIVCVTGVQHGRRHLSWTHKQNYI